MITKPNLKAACARLAACALMAAAAGCKTAHYREKADDETYAILKAKTPEVLGMPSTFSIEKQAGIDFLEGLPRLGAPEEPLGEFGESERNAVILDLVKALEIAVKNSRNYQFQKEALYIEALNLTGDRHTFSPRFRGSADAQIDRVFRTVATGGGGAKSTVLDAAGAPGAMIAKYAELVGQSTLKGTGDGATTRTVEDHRLTRQTSFGVSMLLKGGGRLALDFTSDFLRFITGDSRVATSSALVGSFTQPLLRGAGRKVAAERLTQAERDVLYALRDFTRFRKIFTVDTTNSYYRVLQFKEVLRNNYQNYQSNIESTIQIKARESEGRASSSDLGRQEQSELVAYRNWISSLTRYQNLLDNFKIQLGLPPDAKVVLNDGDLMDLREAGLLHPDISAEDSILIALASRLDFYNDRDFVDDAARNVAVAASDLKAGLDLGVFATVPSTGTDSWDTLNFDRIRYSASVALDLPFDRKFERNAYRRALIDLDRTTRNYSLAEDNIKQDLRAAWRELNEARINYDIQIKAVEVNERRVREQEIRKEIGIATALDIVDAQNDYTGSLNGLVAAIVDHTIIRLQFWRDMGILFIKEGGQWEEIVDDYDLPGPPPAQEAAAASVSAAATLGEV